MCCNKERHTDKHSGKRERASESGFLLPISDQRSTSTNSLPIMDKIKDTAAKATEKVSEVGGKAVEAIENQLERTETLVESGENEADKKPLVRNTPSGQIVDDDTIVIDAKKHR
ncbi:hypothetical protein DdX_15622 [Ditylenchus destructor]|uniref:Uncharacterized protein n=1 Tax=Ditylenchus destructor TaxID=166010 RepID=A0AAD4QUK3_9BILA|nr:hypothetical protein DdX_15622 [Ditylenchus destructor]